MLFRSFGWLVIASVMLFTGCWSSSLWTGANLVYDRHDVYKQVSDFQLAATANRALYKDMKFKCASCEVDVAVFNGDILLAGHVPNVYLRQEAQKRVLIPGYRRIFNQLAISYLPENLVEDGWITTKIRSRILADSSIDPDQFKIVTVDRVVYLLGDVVPSQARNVVYIARSCEGVKRVVKLFKYYHLTDSDKL
jgi:osmotically-inducible protein OsmY